MQKRQQGKANLLLPALFCAASAPGKFAASKDCLFCRAGIILRWCGFPLGGDTAALMLHHLSVRSLLPRHAVVIGPVGRSAALLPLVDGGERAPFVCRREGSCSLGITRRPFGTFNHNIAPDKNEPPASEKPLFLNRFDQANDPALFQLEREQLERRGMLKQQTTDVIDAADVVQPSNHPHQRKGFLKRLRYWHYHQTAEPTFPRTPDLSKGGGSRFFANAWWS